MTHSSVMLVSRKLSFTYKDAEKVWRRLLLINAAMFPFSVFIAATWAISHNKEWLHDVNTITEPIQIALWGLIEFCLSGMFIVKMWKFKWASVERQAMFVLFLVAICDVMSIVLNRIMGDLESTCIKGLVYSLRIRLEVGVLCFMVDFVNRKRKGCSAFSSGGTSSQVENSGLQLSGAENSEFDANV